MIDWRRTSNNSRPVSLHSGSPNPKMRYEYCDAVVRLPTPIYLLLAVVVSFRNKWRQIDPHILIARAAVRSDSS